MPVHAPAPIERVDTPSFGVSSSRVKVKLSPGSTSTREDDSSGITGEVAEAKEEFCNALGKDLARLFKTNKH